MDSPEFPKEEPITIKGHEFTVFQKGVILPKQLSDQVGLVEKPIDDLKPGSQTRKDAIAINSLLDYAAGQEEQMSSVNVFLLDLKGLVIVKAPIMVQDEQHPAVAVLKMSVKDREEFIETLQDPSINSIEMTEILGGIFEINKDQGIKIDRIAAVNLVVYKESTFKIAEALRSGANPERVYRDNINNIVVQKIPWVFRSKDIIQTNEPTSTQPVEQEIDLSEFVEQSVFFRDKSKEPISTTSDEFEQPTEEILFNNGILDYGTYLNSPDSNPQNDPKEKRLKVDPKDFEGVKTMDSMLDIAAQRNSVKHPINIFRFEFEDKDLVFFKIHIKGDYPNVYFVLKTKPGFGKEVIDSLPIDSSGLRNMIDNDVLADGLVILQRSASQIAKDAFIGKADAKTLYEENKDNITIKRIPQV